MEIKSSLQIRVFQSEELGAMKHTKASMEGVWYDSSCTAKLALTAQHGPYLLNTTIFRNKIAFVKTTYM